MLDSPDAYWNISSLFPYSQLFFQSWPLRFHNSVEIIIAFQGSERVLQIMNKILSPLSGDAPSSYWSLQYCSVLGDWSYLPMGSKLKSQYQLIGGKIPQKLSLHQHLEEAIHYFLTPISVIALKTCGIPCPTPSTCRLWFQVIYDAKAAADTAQLTKVYGAELPECSVFTFWSSFLNFSTSFGNMPSFFVLCSREGKPLTRKIWSSLACSKDCRSCICDGISCSEGSLSLPQAAALFSLISLLCSSWSKEIQLLSPWIMSHLLHLGTMCFCPVFSKPREVPNWVKQLQKKSAELLGWVLVSNAGSVVLWWWLCAVQGRDSNPLQPRILVTLCAAPLWPHHFQPILATGYSFWLCLVWCLALS